MNLVTLAVLPVVVTCLWTSPIEAAQRYSVTGLILSVDPPKHTIVVSHAAISGYMEAMVMPFQVREAGALKGLKPSMMVDFTLVVEPGDSYAVDIRPRKYENWEQEPFVAHRLQLLDRLDKSVRTPATLAVGDPAPDFTLTDQTGRPFDLSIAAGKVVGVTFVYTTCPLPNFCFRLSNNFGRLQKRFAERMGRDLVLLSISLDPVHDRPETLAKYGDIWRADPNSWRFLTGPLQDVKSVCRKFGVNFWPDEGVVTHSLRTIILDRQGRVAANFEGNEFTAEQLGDFVEAVLIR